MPIIVFVISIFPYDLIDTSIVRLALKLNIVRSLL